MTTKAAMTTYAVLSDLTPNRATVVSLHTAADDDTAFAAAHAAAKPYLRKVIRVDSGEDAPTVGERIWIATDSDWIRVPS